MFPEHIDQPGGMWLALANTLPDDSERVVLDVEVSHTRDLEYLEPVVRKRLQIGRQRVVAPGR